MDELIKTCIWTGRSKVCCEKKNTSTCMYIYFFQLWNYTIHGWKELLDIPGSDIYNICCVVFIGSSETKKTGWTVDGQN